MRYVLGGLLILAGAGLVGLAINNQLGQAWQVITSQAGQLSSQTTGGA